MDDKVRRLLGQAVELIAQTYYPSPDAIAGWLEDARAALAASAGPDKELDGMKSGRGGDSIEALRAVWMEGYNNASTRHAPAIAALRAIVAKRDTYGLAAVTDTQIDDGRAALLALDLRP